MRFPAKKRWHSLPPSGCLGTPLPLPQSVRTDGRTDVRTYGCTDVRTDGHVTIKSQPKFLGLISYHISLAMELRWRALPAGSAKKTGFSVLLIARVGTSSPPPPPHSRLIAAGCPGMVGFPCEKKRQNIFFWIRASQVNPAP